MAFDAKRSTVLACIPSAISQEERAAHFVLAKYLLTDAAEQREALPEGYAFRFPAEMFESIAKFIVNERKCCPFMQFEISLSANSGAILLRMTGPNGTRELIDAEVGIASSVSCKCGHEG